jgi:cell division transport system permease protein
MMLDRIWASGPEARLLPAEKLHGPTVALMAIMTFAMILVAAAGLALANAASSVSSAAEARYVLELPSAVAGQLPKAIAAAKSVPGVREVTTVPESEMRRTLERWLGAEASAPDLPVPALAMVDLDPSTDPAAVAAAVARQVREARMSAESAQLAPLLAPVRGLQWLALSLVALMAAATAAAIILAARGALDTHRATVEIMHRIGATDGQVTRLFQRKIAVDSVVGSLFGSGGALAVLFMLGADLAAAAGELSTGPLGWADGVILALIPAAAVAIAVAVAHWTLLRALRATL